MRNEIRINATKWKQVERVKNKRNTVKGGGKSKNKTQRDTVEGSGKR